MPSLIICAFPAFSVFFLCAVMLFLAGCGKDAAKDAGPLKPKVVPVMSAMAETKSLSRQLKTFGTVEAYKTVSIKSMITGQLLQVHVKPGQLVEKGQLLFSIDNRSFVAILKQCEAALARNKTLADDAIRQAELKEKLFKSSIASEDEVKRVRAAAEALKSAILADEATIEKTKLDIEYCEIKSPINGRIGEVLQNEGSVIKANDAAIAIVAQVQPVYVTFSLPQNELPTVRAEMAAGDVGVEVRLPREHTQLDKGNLDFIDNVVDSDTGTVKLKASFPNAKERLWPGQFLELSLTLEQEENVVVVPAQAVQTGQSGTYVFVVGSGKKIEMRPVKSVVIGEDAIIREGVSSGEQVVTDGHLRLTPGCQVEIKNTLLPSPAPAPKDQAVPKQ
ncbi:MAG: hypothetical protein A2X49_01655 [Lentisphaerae bacterium GWF2_52_8]|nr:MAG: hypothetical protein A2X49_01655 [Lentisphaerae bacterium GWF2_52_8]